MEVKKKKVITIAVVIAVIIVIMGIVGLNYCDDGEDADRKEQYREQFLNVANDEPTDAIENAEETLNVGDMFEANKNISQNVSEDGKDTESDTEKNKKDKTDSANRESEQTSGNKEVLTTGEAVQEEWGRLY